MSKLTAKETRVLRLICEEMTSDEIAERLGLSPRTIQSYRETLGIKIGAKNVVGLVMYAIENGLVDGLRWSLAEARLKPLHAVQDRLMKFRVTNKEHEEEIGGVQMDIYQFMDTLKE